MKSIVYVGMDVHKDSYTVCCFRYDEDKLQYQQKLAPDYKMILKYLEQGIEAEALLADRAYDKDAIISQAKLLGMEVVFPPKKNRKVSGNMTKTSICFATWSKMRF